MFLSLLHHSSTSTAWTLSCLFLSKMVRSNILRVQPIYPHTEFFSFPFLRPDKLLRGADKSKVYQHPQNKIIKKIQTKRWLQEHPQNQGKTKCFPVLKPLRIYKSVGRNLFHHLKIIIFKLNLIYVTLVIPNVVVISFTACLHYLVIFFWRKGTKKELNHVHINTP